MRRRVVVLLFRRQVDVRLLILVDDVWSFGRVLAAEYVGAVEAHFESNGPFIDSLLRCCQVCFVGIGMTAKDPVGRERVVLHCYPVSQRHHRRNGEQIVLGVVFIVLTIVCLRPCFRALAIR